jgi:hypothetical protein
MTSACRSSQPSPGSWCMRTTGGKALAHDRDHLAVGGRLLLQRPGGEQVQTGAHLGAGHERIGAAAVAAGGL